MRDWSGLPQSWSVAPLELLAEINPRGGDALPESSSSLAHFVPMRAVQEEFGGIDVSTRRPLSEVRKGYTSFQAGDVLFAKITPCMENGKLAIVPALDEGIGFGSTEFHVMRTRDRVAPRWLAYFLSQAEFRKFARMHMTGSAGQLRVATPWLAKATLPLAPFAEQTRIVDKLEELLSDLDAGVAELKAAQKKLAQYRQSLLKAAVEGQLTAAWREQNGEPEESGAQLLARILRERRARWEARQLAKFQAQSKAPPKGWRDGYQEPVPPEIDCLPTLPEAWTWASVEQVASDEDYGLAIGPFGSNLKVSDYRDAGVPLVFVRNIRSGRYGGDFTKYVSPEKAQELLAHSVSGGDVLITKMGEPPGDADVYPLDQPSAVITADCIKVRCCSGLHARFLTWVVNSEIGRRQIRPMTQGVAQKKVSLGRFSRLAVPLAPWAEQLEVVELASLALRDADEKARAIDHALRQSAAQRKNILKAAFSGQLVPQDPKDEPASVLLERIRAERAARTAVEAKPRRRQAQATS